MVKKCTTNNRDCIYHACMSDDCQKEIMIEQAGDFGPAKCEKIKPWTGIVKSNIQMEPTIGRIVIFNMPDYLKNGVNGNKSEKLPAIIVGVHGPTCVNLKVITDG